MQNQPFNSPAPSQESIADYPEHPVVVPDSRRVTVRFNGEVIADSSRTHRVLQRGLPPAFYIPPEDVHVEFLVSNQRQTWCDYKGDAHYYDIAVVDRVSESAAWCYPEPKEGFGEIQYAIAFYADRVDSCTVDGEPVTGHSSGGWITGEITGTGDSS